MASAIWPTNFARPAAVSASITSSCSLNMFNFRMTVCVSGLSAPIASIDVCTQSASASVNASRKSSPAINGFPFASSTTAKPKLSIKLKYR